MNGSCPLGCTARQLSIGTSPAANGQSVAAAPAASSIWSGTINLGQVVLAVVSHCPLLGETASSTTLAAWLEQEPTRSP